MRASLLTLGAGTGALSPFLASCAAPSGSADRGGGGEPIVETRYGKLRGVDSGGIKSFKGIHYGGDTGGKSRFLAPTEPEAWTGVRDAFDFGRVAPQVLLDPKTASEYGLLIQWDQQRGGVGEDCLVLNVWTPGLDDAKRPVMVSLHGGGFTTGSGAAPGYDGDPLARFGDVVVVTINHRLGVFGYLHLADLGAPPEFDRAGVAGMMDVVAALGWVHEHIAAFGGDPGNVTVFGQSGGGAKTSTLLAMPSGKGLFQRAGVQSGSSLRMRTREEGTAAAEKLLAKVGLDKSRIAELQDLPMERILDAQTALAGEASFAPVVDGTVLPRHPFDPDAPPVSADVPMIIGTTLDDAALSLTNFDLDEAGLEAVVGRVAGAHADHVLSVYRQAYPEVSPFLVQARILTDRGFRRGADSMAERKAAQGAAPAYLYLWEWPCPAKGGKFGAVHGIDVGLTFHNPAGEFYANASPSAVQMADRFAAAWVAFARSGDPNTKEIPSWPAYEATGRPTMIFDTETRVENDPLHEMRELWNEIA